MFFSLIIIVFAFLIFYQKNYGPAFIAEPLYVTVAFFYDSLTNSALSKRKVKKAKVKVTVVVHLKLSAAALGTEEFDRGLNRVERIAEALALDNVPLDAVSVGNREETIPLDALGARLAGLTENGIEFLYALAHSVLLGVKREGAVGILLVLLAGIKAGAGRPAHILLHLNALIGILKEVIPVELVRSEDRLHLKLPLVVMKTDESAGLRGRLGCLVVIFDEHLHEAGRHLGRRTGAVPLESRRNIAAAGAANELIAVAELEIKSLLDVLGRETIAGDMGSATLKTVVVEHLLDLGGAETAVARELNAGVAELLHVFKSLGEADLLDVTADGIKLETDLGRNLSLTAARRGANLGAATRGKSETAKHRGRTEKVSSGNIHFYSLVDFVVLYYKFSIVTTGMLRWQNASVIGLRDFLSNS